MAGDLAKVNASNVSNFGVRVRRSGTRKNRHDSEGLFELDCEDKV